MSDAPRRTYLSVRNWPRYQHYGKLRRPSWVKLYAHLLDDADDHKLPISTRLLWRQMLLLAAKHENAVPHDAKLIAAQSYLPLRTVREGLLVLLDLKWLQENKRDRFSRGGSRGRPRTGWRFVRGSHSGHYVPDPEGTDVPPYAARSASVRGVA